MFYQTDLQPAKYSLPYPHASKARNTHKGKEDGARLGASQAEHFGYQYAVDVGLA
jgi:hypothetical protein